MLITFHSYIYFKYGLFNTVVIVINKMDSKWSEMEKIYKSKCLTSIKYRIFKTLFKSQLLSSILSICSLNSILSVKYYL